MSPIRTLVSVRVAAGLVLGAAVAHAPGGAAARGAPPAPVPVRFIAAVNRAFQHGLPDPRGGEFREVTVVDGQPWDGTVSKCRVTGWVMPPARGRPTCVICWNGVPYKPASIGPKKDLAAFTAGTLYWDPAMGRRVLGIEEASNPRTIVGAALLLRVGRADLAAKTLVGLAIPADPGRSLAIQIARFRFNRAVFAHAGGDDRLALADCEWLSTQRQSFGPLPRGVEALAADSRRRLAEGLREPLIPHKLKEPPTSARIRAVLDRLDDVRGAFRDQLEWSSADNDPVFRAAIEAGKPIVDKLLDSANTDGRLTRAVKQVRDAPPEWRAVTVGEIALETAGRIIEVPFPCASPYERVDPKAVRRLWDATKRLSPKDRLFRVLASDDIGPDQWLDAAVHVVGISDIMGRPQFQRDHHRQAAPSMPGESLRRHTNPSLTELMAKRLLSMMPSADGRSPIAKRQAKDTVRMARCLAKWDSAGSRQTLQAVYSRIAGVVPKLPYDPMKDWADDPKNMLGTLIRLRLSAGDLTAEADYESLIYSDKARLFGFPSWELLSPLLEKPEWGDRVAGRLFVGSRAMWNPALELRRGGLDVVDLLIRSKLPSLASVRQCLIDAMRDKTVIGEAWRRPEKQGLEFTLRSGGGGGIYYMGMEAKDRRDLPFDRKVPLRVCDYVAFVLAEYNGAPRFRPYWSVEARDAAAEETIAYVQRVGSALPNRRPEWEQGRGD